MKLKDAVKWLIGIEDEIKKEDEKGEEMKLKVGDKVLLKSLEECRKTPLWVIGDDYAMDSFADSVVTVRQVDVICNRQEESFFRIEGSRWAYCTTAIAKKIDADPEPTPKDDFELLFGFTD